LKSSIHYRRLSSLNLKTFTLATKVFDILLKHFNKIR